MADSEHHKEAADQDLGPPVAELALLSVKPTRGWLTHIRERINRKLLMADSLDFLFQALSRSFMVYLGSILQLFTTKGADRERNRR